MRKVYWQQGIDKFSSLEDFVAEVELYNQAIAPELTEWNSKQVICTGPITIRYEALWKDEEDLLEVIVSTVEEPITMGQLLFRLHNESVEFFRDTDHCFFEGFEESQPGTLWLCIGS